MSDQTLGLIYAIKHNDFRWDLAVKYYMSDITGCDFKVYSETDLYQILKEALLDYLKVCNNPSNVVRLLLEKNEHDGNSSMAHKIAVVLMMQQVKDKEGNFINGFRKIN